jgi:hypothetical protein
MKQLEANARLLQKALVREGGASRKRAQAAVDELELAVYTEVDAARTYLLAHSHEDVALAASRDN